MNISSLEVGEIYAVTRDISESGVFILLDREDLPEIGEVVKVQVQGLPGDEAPWVKMQVTRYEPSGIGMKILD